MSARDARRNSSWIGCIDFGTALSKIAMVRAVSRAKIEPSDIRPLAIALRPGFSPRNPFLLPSVVFIAADRILFGQEAEETAARMARSRRRAFSSPKQYLSTHELSDLNDPLELEIDPLGQFNAGHLLRLFLAHLLQSGGRDALRQGLPWPVPMRIARPAWEANRAGEGEAILKTLIADGFALADRLGGALCEKGGLEFQSALEALSNIPALTADEETNLFAKTQNGSASILEATAVAAGSIRNTGRRIVVVADIGGGTSDFGAFMTGTLGHEVIAEISSSSSILREAGDYLDMQLRRFILNKAHLLEDDPAARGVANSLRNDARRNKEILFSEKKLAVAVGEEDILFELQEFLEDPAVKAFSLRLRARFENALKVAVDCAKQHSPRGQRVPVEVLRTGGGFELPMVKDLAENPGVHWHFTEAAPEIAERFADLDFEIVQRQLAVAIGGAMQDLPKQTSPIRQ